MKKYCCLELKRGKKNPPLGRSCFFGDPDLTKKAENLYQDDDYFLCQLNLEEIKNAFPTIYLPKHGMLYFFVSLDSLNGKVLYSDYQSDNDFNRIEFNEGFHFKNKEYSIKLSFHNHHHDFMILYENQKISGIRENEIVLLKVHFKKLLNYNKKFYLYYVINKEDLLKMDYSRVRTIISHR